MADPPRNRPPASSTNGRAPTPGTVPNPSPRRNAPAPTGAQRTGPPNPARPTSGTPRPAGSGPRPAGAPQRPTAPGPRPQAGRPVPATRPGAPTGPGTRRPAPPAKATGLTGAL